MKQTKGNLIFLLAVGLLPFSLIGEVYGEAAQDFSHWKAESAWIEEKSSLGENKEFLIQSGQRSPILTLTEVNALGERAAQKISIADGRKIIALNEKEALQKAYTIEGVCTSNSAHGKYIQDSTGGILIYFKNINGNIQTGTRYQLTGKLSNYKGQYQITVENAEDMVEQGKEQLSPKNISYSEILNYPDQLVKVKGNWNFIKDKNGKNYIFQWQANDGSFLDIKDLRENPDFKFDSTMKMISVTGIASSYQNSPQINVRFQKDITLADSKEDIQETTIDKIQGDTHLSPFVNKYVQTKGIVTAISNDRYNPGFYITSLKEDRDNDDATSEGLYVNAGKDLPAGLGLGSQVTVKGIVKERVFNTWSNQLPNTTLEMKGIEVSSEPKVNLEDYITKINVTDIPTKVYAGNLSAEKLATTKLRPKENALDYYESLEGMLVSVSNPKIVMSKEANSDIFVLPDKGEGADVIWTKNGGVKYTYEKQNPQVLVLTDNSWTKNKKWVGGFNPQEGDYFDGNAIGVMGFNFNRYRIFPMGKPLPTLIKGNLTPGSAKFDRDEDHLYFATYNVENFSAKDRERGEKIAEQIVTKLCAPDIIGLVEIQDNDGQPAKGEQDSKITAADQTLALLTDQLKAKGYQYEAVNIDPRPGNLDGGAPGGNIRPVFLYRKDRVKLTEGVQGPNDVTDSYENGKLKYNPGVLGLEQGNDAFHDSRKPLVAEFEMISGKFAKEKFLFIGNHFNSKGGDDPIFGPNQPPVRMSEVQRKKQAQYIANFVAKAQEQDPHVKIVCMGDFNDFEFSQALAPLKNNLKDVIDILPIEQRYTYQYEGNAQTLDHIFLTDNLAKFVSAEDVSPIHINAEFTEEMGRVSDHDPLLVRIPLKKDNIPNPSPEPIPQPNPQPNPSPQPQPVPLPEEDYGSAIDFSKLPKPQRDQHHVEERVTQQGEISYQLKEVTGYITGYPDKTFRPDQNITRGETAAILCRLIDTSVVGKSEFSDVNSNDWYAKDIDCLTSLGIIAGYKDNTFRPKQFITRAEFARLVVKLLKWENRTVKESHFKDLENCWAKNSIEILAQEGILKGDGKGYFRPSDCITRAEAVVVLNQVAKLSNVKKDIIFSDVQGHWAREAIEKACR